MRNARAPARSLLALIALLAMSGCEHPGVSPYGKSPHVAPVDRPVLATHSAEYLPGSPVTLRLTNTLRRSFGYNLCRSFIEREEDGDWGQAQPIAEVCTAEIRTLRPGQAVTFSFPLPQVRRGNYRIRTELEDLPARTRLPVVSNTFVQPGNASD